MSTHVPGFQSFFSLLHSCVLVKLATSSIRVNVVPLCVSLVPSGHINSKYAGADPASEFDRCTIRLLKDHHIFSSSKCPREGGGGLSYIS